MIRLTIAAVFAGILLFLVPVAIADGYLPEQHRGPQVDSPRPSDQRDAPVPPEDGKGGDDPPAGGAPTPPDQPEPPADGDDPDPEPPAPPEPPEDNGGKGRGRDERAGNPDLGSGGTEPPAPPPAPPTPPHT